LTLPPFLLDSYLQSIDNPEAFAVEKGRIISKHSRHLSILSSCCAALGQATEVQGESSVRSSLSSMHSRAAMREAHWSLADATFTSLGYSVYSNQLDVGQIEID
jgi:hypothetical protein